MARAVNYTAKRCAEHLVNAFLWNSTPEGSEFWADVCSRIKQIGRDGITHASGHVAVKSARAASQLLAELTREEVNKARITARLLVSAFTWGDTDEGHEFWSEVHGRILEIAHDQRKWEPK